jgi:5-methylcytosine-specific restriction protein B
MIDGERLREILDYYIADFDDVWGNERVGEQYKWKMVQHFQNIWDLKANDFARMLEDALSKTSDILASGQYYPRAVIVGFAEKEPECVRSMFADLFDEGGDYVERVEGFKRRAGELHRMIEGDDTTNNHYQDESAITAYLWLRYPDRYYHYKYTITRPLSAKLKSDHVIKKGAYANNLRSHRALYNEVRAALVEDGRVASVLAAHLTDDDYPDETLHTATADVAYYVAKRLDAREASWWPSPDEYSPGIGPERWSELLRDPEVFAENHLAIVSRFLEAGGFATCKELSQRFGETSQYYIGGSIALAKRVHEATGCPLPASGENARWWPVLYVGRGAKSQEDGTYVWRLRDELKQALEEVVDVSEAKGEDVVDSDAGEPVCIPYTHEDFLRDVYMSPARYERLRGVLLTRKNVILQGPPGVGKTFAARRLAWSIMGEQDNERIGFVQFHQSYSYEDFVMGYRPDGEGFRLRSGVFYDFCAKASADPGHDYFFIIDEINRADLSKVLGELMMLIERGYRGVEVTLPYDGKPFSVPDNLFVIGMMNTADRSLAMIDYALRRRFAFFEMEPGFDSEGFSRYAERLKSETMDDLVVVLRDLNDRIRSDRSLGRGFCIGHSYLCGRIPSEAQDDEWLRAVVDFDIVPTLEEYWFDDPDSVHEWEARLHGVFQ